MIAEDKMIADIKQCMKMHSINISDHIKALQGAINVCINMSSAMDEKMQSICREMCEIIVQIRQNTLEIKTFVESTLEIAEQNVKQTKNAITESLNAHKIIVTQHSDQFIQAKLPNDYKAKQFALKQIAHQTMTLACGTLERAAINGTSSMECGVEHFKTHLTAIPLKRDTIALNGQMQALNNDWNKHQHRLAEENKENTDAINNISQQTDEFCEINAGKIALCVNQLKHFGESEFCEYQPSGNYTIYI